MIDIKLIRQDKERVLEGLKRKNFNAEGTILDIVELDEEYRSIKTKIENLTSVINKNNIEIGKNIKTDLNKVEELKEENKILKTEIEEWNSGLKEIEDELNNLLCRIPNIAHESVPLGLTEENNEVIREDLSKLDASYGDTKAHWDYIKEKDIINFDLGVKITGAGFPVYKGNGAKLQRALIQYFLDYNIENGYEEYSLPYLVNDESAYGTGQLPDKEGQMYFTEKDNLYLIPTGEVPLTNIYRDEIVKDLPIKMTGYTPCFRRESGSYGKEVRGLNRVHQFDKVEIVQIVEPEKSYEVLEEMVTHVEGLLKSLELPYRIIKLCGGDTSFASALTYDFEVWSLVQERWLEVSSVSNFETFQANRMKIRYKNGKKKGLVHTLNGSALALPRIVACMIENNQTTEGVRLPKVLEKYYGDIYLK